MLFFRKNFFQKKEGKLNAEEEKRQQEQDQQKNIIAASTSSSPSTKFINLCQKLKRNGSECNGGKKQPTEHRKKHVKMQPKSK